MEPREQRLVAEADAVRKVEGNSATSESRDAVPKQAQDVGTAGV
jgi:hypothetical protein